MNKRFITWTDAIIKHIEGGYVNDPHDSGGATRYGITESVARKNGYKGGMRDFPLALAHEIYFKDYWQGKIQSYTANRLGLCIYDASINSGYKQAIKLLQRALGVTDDGIVGVQTMDAIGRISESEAVERFNTERIKFYRSLKNYDRFGRGWENRIKLLETEDFYVNRQDYLD